MEYFEAHLKRIIEVDESIEKIVCDVAELDADFATSLNADTMYAGIRTDGAAGHQCRCYLRHRHQGT